MDSDAVEASSRPFSEAVLLGWASGMHGVLLGQFAVCAWWGLFEENPNLPTIFATTWIVQQYRLAFKLSESGLDNLGARYSRDQGARWPR